jgi:hypothetical protein
MAVAFVLDFPGGTMEQYNQVVERMHLDGQMAAGGLIHVAGSYQGGLRVIDVWEDSEHFQRFSEEQIVPHTQALGLPEPTVRMMPVEQQREGNGQTPVLVQCVTLPGLDREAFMDADADVVQGEIPDGITWHVNGPVDGGWCVIDGWISKEQRDELIESRVKPAMADAPMQGPPQIEDLMVETTMGPGLS